MSEEIEAAAEALGDRVQRDVPIGPLTTYRVGGVASLFMRIDSDDDIELLASAVTATGVATLVVGKGSNLLVADAGFEGLAVVLGEAFEHIDIDAQTVVAGAAASLPVVARRTAVAGLTGFEWAVGVPGSIGGAVRMNAGGHGSDMARVLTRVHVADLATGDHGWMAATSLALGYRRSSIAASQVVLKAELALAEGDRTQSETEIAEIVRWRRENQPGGQNAGSVFTNPVGDSAGRLIDEAGCKGLRVGSAAVSEKHANFFIADPGGRAGDVVALMRTVRTRVHDALGVSLEPETRLVGFDDDPAGNPSVEVES